MATSEEIYEKTLRERVDKILSNTYAIDIHTHLFPPTFESKFLNGYVNLLSYHYLIEEFLKIETLEPEEFYSLDKENSAELIWKALFVTNTPISEATSGIIEIANLIGGKKGKGITLNALKKILPYSPTEIYCKKIFDIAKLSAVVMTNDPFDPVEVHLWRKNGWKVSNYFIPSIRLDSLFNNTKSLIEIINASGFDINLANKDRNSILRNYLDMWIEKIHPAYMAASFSDDFNMADQDKRSEIMKEIVLPTCRKHKLALALMLGAVRGVNPSMREAGDSVKRVDLNWLSDICRTYSENKFLVTGLSKENQQELVVLSRKFANLMVFGAWWFLNTDSQVREITRLRFELLGTSFIPQHSDSRILEQVVYKWARTRKIVSELITEKYLVLHKVGWDIKDSEIQGDITKLLSKNFTDFIKK